MHFKVDYACLLHCGGTEETQLLNGARYSWGGGWTLLPLSGLGLTPASLSSQGEWGCCGSRGGSGVSESSVLNQTNTVEFLPLLVQRVEWQGCIAELPVSRDDSGSTCDHPVWHCLILRQSLIASFRIAAYRSTQIHTYIYSIRIFLLDHMYWLNLWKKCFCT